MPTAVTITGTRSTGHRPLDDYRRLLEEFVAPFARPGVRFYLGGASGIDSIALLWLAAETEADLTVVVPAKVGDQPADAQHAITTARAAQRLADLVELGGETRTPGFNARNRYMVDRSTFVIGFPLAGTTESGTHHTLNHAATLNLPRLVLPV